MKIFKKSLSIVLCLAMIMSLFVGLGTLTASAAAVRTSPSALKSTNMVHGGSSHTYCYGSTICESCTAPSSSTLTVTAGTETAELSVRDDATINAFLTFYSSAGEPLATSSSSRHAFVIKYKVTKIGEGGYAQLGIGSSTKQNNTAWVSTDIHGVGRKHTEVSDKEYTLTAVVPKKSTKGFERLLVAGAGCEIKITYFARVAEDSSNNKTNFVTFKLSDECETVYTYAAGDIGTTVIPFGTGAQDAKFYDENGNEVTTVSGDMTVTAVLKEQYGYRQMLSAGEGVKWYSEVATTLSDMKGSGTADDPYIITNDAELRCAIREGGSRHYKLGNDIVINDSTDPEWYNGYGLKNWIKGVKEDGSTSDAYQGYEMSGSSSVRFKGTFDGNGYTISGLYINYIASGLNGAQNSYSSFALFPTVEGATIKNLKLKDVYVTSNVTDTTAEHAYGALIGHVFTSEATVENVAIENVKFELNRTTELTGDTANSAKLVVGGVAAGLVSNIKISDVTVKNISATVSGSYATWRQPRYIGTILGFAPSGKTYNINNVISYGNLDPFSVKNDKTSTNTSTSSDFVTRSDSTVNNVITVGGDVVEALADTVVKFDNEAAFLNSLDTFYNNIGESTNWSAKVEGRLPKLKTFVNQIVVDFEDDSYTVGGNNCVDTDGKWSIVTEDGNSYLQRSTNDPNGNNTVGFMVPGTIIPGRNYQITFKAMSDKDVTLNYSILTAKNNWTGNHSGGNIDNNRFDIDRKTAKLTANTWKEISTYFTAKTDYNGGKNPFIYLNLSGAAWQSVYSFDDILITEVEGISYNEYGNKYGVPYIAGVSEGSVVPPAPERENYIFEGWYLDSDYTLPLTSDTVVIDYMTAFAKWEEAVTTKEDIAEITTTGIHDLGIKVTNANAYPIKFSLVTDGEVTVSIFTASADDATVSQSVVWTRTFERGGDVGALIEPAVISGGNNLYISVDGAITSISEFVIGGEGVATSRKVEGDVNGDDEFNILDLVRLKKMAVGISTVTWLGDLDGDGFVAEATDLTANRKGLLGVSSVVTTMGDRTLVWNEEFNSGKLNSSNFGYLDAYRANTVTYNTVDTLNYYDGKANLKVNNLDGTDYKTPNVLTTGGKMSFNKGYLEVRAKINAVPGQWAAIWLSGDKDESTVYHGEIDIVETNSSGTSFSNNIHAWKDGESDQVPSDYKSSYNYEDKNFNKTEYHIFGFEWNDTEIIYYVDGVEYGRSDITTIKGLPYDGETLLTKSYPFADIFDQFYSLRLDNMIYSSTLTPDGAMPEFNIDYVRLYQKAGEQLKINGVLVEK